MNLIKCKEHNEIFVVEDGKKCWVENWETFVYLAKQAGTTWEEFLARVERIPFEELRAKYPIGPTKVKKTITIVDIAEGKKPRDIFYPEESENPYSWVRGLLTLKPLPSAQRATELGFNLIAPFAGLPSGWTGKVAYTSRHIRDDSRAMGYWPSDEPGCHKHDPYADLETVKDMKKKTNLPVGLALVSDLGCGTARSGYTKEEYKEAWVEVANQVDWLRLTTYPYRKPPYNVTPSPLEEMEYWHNWWSKYLTVPIVPVIQSHTTYKLFKPNPMEQVKFWVSRGYGYIVYPWSNPKQDVRGVVDMQEEWREANEWAKSNI